MEKHRLEYGKANIENMKNKVEIAKRCLTSAIENIDNFEHLMKLIKNDFDEQNTI